jgi:putative SOS response-associated peptidase YedK
VLSNASKEKLMCGRYAVTLPPEAMASLFGSGDLPNLAPRYNVAPTQVVPAVAIGRDGTRKIIQPRWGLRPAWMTSEAKTGPLFNARSETVAAKPTFRAAFARKRCLLPADGFYEWQKHDGIRTPHFIARKDRAPIAFAGLWEHAPALEPALSASIVTKPATEAFTYLHDRFPVILPPEAWAAWLDPATPAPVLHRLIAEASDGEMMAFVVSDRVNKVANDTPDLLEPVAV